MKTTLLLAALLAFPSLVLAQSSEDILRPATGHALVYGITSTTDDADKDSPAGKLGSQTRVIRITTTTDALFAFEATRPLATRATGGFLPAFVVEYFRVNPGEFIAMIASGTTGEVFYQEMTR